jgi:hypothetical protein
MTFQRIVGVAALATGRVEKLRADLVVFDPDTVEALDEKRIDEHTGVSPGRVLCSHTAVPA